MRILESYFLLTLVISTSSSNGEFSNEIDEKDLWPNAIIPFYIEENHFGPKEKLFIMSSILRIASKTCLKFQPLTYQPKNIQFLLIQNINRIQKCKANSAVHSKGQYIVTMGYDCVHSKEFDIILLQALTYSAKPTNHKNINSMIKDIHTRYNKLCRQRDSRLELGRCKQTRKKRDIKNQKNNLDVTTRKATNFTPSNLTRVNDTDINLNKINALAEILGVNEVNDFINNVNNIGSKILAQVRLKYCTETEAPNAHNRRDDNDNAANPENTSIFKASGFTWIGKMFQPVLRNMDLKAILFDFKDRSKSKSN